MRRILLATAFALIATTATAKPLAQEVDACAAQSLTWCKPGATVANPAPNQDSVLAKIAVKARMTVSYDITDQRKTDTWRSYADKAEAGTTWAGDCDDLTLTTIEMAVAAGVEPSRLYRALVSSEVEGRKQNTRVTAINHMVAIYRDTSGTLWVIGNTNTRVPQQRLDQAGENIRYVSNVAKGMGWERPTALNAQ